MKGCVGFLQVFHVSVTSLAAFLPPILAGCQRATSVDSKRAGVLPQLWMLAVRSRYTPDVGRLAAARARVRVVCNGRRASRDLPSTFRVRAMWAGKCWDGVARESGCVAETAQRRMRLRCPREMACLRYRGAIDVWT
jgi:hypothetical protein